MPLSQKEAMINAAIKSKQILEIIYLTNQDEQSHRQIRPLFVGQMEYKGKTFPGMKVFCELRKEERTLRVDRILEMKVVAEGKS